MTASVQQMPCRRTRLFWIIVLLAFWLLSCPGTMVHAARKAAHSATLPVRAAILINMNTGRVLYEQQADTAIPPASLTKVMTMFLALDAVKAKRTKLGTRVRVSRQAAATGGSSMHLRSGERVPLVRLLTGMAVASGNDAAMAVAQHINSNMRVFVRQMNRKARALGMRRTVFKNPSGLPAAGQKTTARDMAAMARAYLKAHPQALRFHNTRFFLHQGKAMRNTNALLGKVNGVNGLKTGWTVASGYNLIVTAKRGKVRLVAVVLGGKNREQRDLAAQRLIEAGFRHPGSPKKVRQRLLRR